MMQLDIWWIMISIQPSDGYVLVKPFKATQNTAGIVAPASLQNQNKVEIIALPKLFNPNTATVNGIPESILEIGDIIYVADYIDPPIMDGENKYYFVLYIDILGKEINY